MRGHHCENNAPLKFESGHETIPCLRLDPISLSSNPSQRGVQPNVKHCQRIDRRPMAAMKENGIRRAPGDFSCVSRETSGNPAASAALVERSSCASPDSGKTSMLISMRAVAEFLSRFLSRTLFRFPTSLRHQMRVLPWKLNANAPCHAAIIPDLVVMSDVVFRPPLFLFTDPFSQRACRLGCGYFCSTEPAFLGILRGV